MYNVTLFTDRVDELGRVSFDAIEALLASRVILRLRELPSGTLVVDLMGIWATPITLYVVAS